jgi:hypothetical protein
MAEKPTHGDWDAQGNEQKDNRGGDFEKSPRMAFLTRFGEISALFAVVGVAVCFLGLLALWTSISADTGFSSLAWQVVAISATLTFSTGWTVNEYAFVSP